MFTPMLPTSNAHNALPCSCGASPKCRGVCLAAPYCQAGNSPARGLPCAPAGFSALTRVVVPPRAGLPGQGAEQAGGLRVHPVAAARRVPRQQPADVQAAAQGHRPGRPRQRAAGPPPLLRPSKAVLTGLGRPKVVPCAIVIKVECFAFSAEVRVWMVSAGRLQSTLTQRTCGTTAWS